MSQETLTPEQVIAKAILNDQVNAMLDAYGLNWKVVKEPLSFRGIETGFFGLVRQDKDICYNCVPDSYQPYQNDELAELLIRVCEKTGFEMHKGGMFGDGAKVYLQLKIGELTNFAKNRDTIQSLATAINFHNYNGSMKWGSTTIPISCSNTFNAAYHQLQNSARHTKKMKEKIEEALREVEYVTKVQENLFGGFKRMSEIEIAPEILNKVVELVTGKDISIGREAYEAEYRPVTLERIDSLLGAIQNQTEEKGETLWGLFSGVTYYTTHLAKEKREGGRMESKYLSTGLETDNKVYSFLNQLV